MKLLPQIKFLTIGEQNSRRVAFWEAALCNSNFEHNLLTYEQVLNGDFPKITRPTVLRITSPGENFDLKKRLFTEGGMSNADQLVFEKGLIYPNPFWYRGWCLILEKIADFIKRNPLLQVMNYPAAIQLAFHKLTCQKRLQSQGIRIPNIIIEKVLNYESLLQTLQKKRISQVFIKPYHGSSASGVMALRQTAGKQMLYTTIDQKSTGLYNNLRLQRYTNLDKIKAIIDTMIPSGLMVEQWIPKRQFQQKSVDFRVLVINGEAVFVVPRMSKHVITNLHLGNEKGDILAIEREWGTAMIQRVKQLAVEAVKAVDDLFYAGVDVAVSTKGDAYILEINAFGDLLLNIEKEGMNTYEYELQAWLKAYSTFL